MYLLDTDVWSELRKRKCDPAVARWFGKVPDSELYLSVITFTEIQKGVERQRSIDPAFAEQLDRWVDLTLRSFSERVLPLSVNVARRWGRLAAQIGNTELDLAIGGKIVYESYGRREAKSDKFIRYRFNQVRLYRKPDRPPVSP